MFPRRYFVPNVCSEAICQPCRISINQDDIALLLLLVFRDLQQARFNSLKVLLPSILLSTLIPVKLVENITFQHQWLKLWFGSNEQKAESCNSNLNFQLRRVETNLRAIRGILNTSISQQPNLPPNSSHLLLINWRQKVLVCLFDKIYL